MINPFFYRGRGLGYLPYNNYNSFSYGDSNYRYNKWKNKHNQDTNYDSKKNYISSNYVNKFDDKKDTKKISKEANNIEEKPIFEIFGIKLFFDDVLIISLIFFLYNEGVQDKSLFIVLILILLS